ncbi:MAG TPA: DUF4783 domain-containing protein [Arachidicoccus sp.]
MKNFLITAASALLLMSFTVVVIGMNDIIAALKQADPVELAKHLDSYVDIKLPNKDEVKNVSKNQAGITLKDFYSEQNITSFELSSQREMSGTGYLTGKLKSDSRSYNITVMVKTKGDTSYIVSVRIN